MAPHQLDSANREEQGCMAPIPRLWLTVNRISLLQASSSCCRFVIAMVEAYSKDDAPDGVFLPVSQPLCSFCSLSHEEEWCFRTREASPKPKPWHKVQLLLGMFWKKAGNLESAKETASASRIQVATDLHVQILMYLPLPRLTGLSRWQCCKEDLLSRLFWGTKLNSSWLMESLPSK